VNTPIKIFFLKNMNIFLLAVKLRAVLEGHAARPLKKRAIGCPETSVRNYHYTLRNPRRAQISVFTSIQFRQEHGTEESDEHGECSIHGKIREIDIHKHEGRREFWVLGYIWEDNIKSDYKVIKRDGTYWTRQYEDRNKAGSFDSINKIWAARKAGSSVTS